MSDQTVAAFDRLCVATITSSRTSGFGLMIKNYSNDCDLGTAVGTMQVIVGPDRLLYPLAVDNRHTFEKVFQLYDVLFDC